MKEQGFTLIEMLISILIVAIILRFGVPEMNKFIERNRIKGAAEAVYNEINFARSQSIKTSTTRYMKFVSSGTSTWSFGIDDATGCDPTAALGGTNPCAIPASDGGTNVLKSVVNGSSNPAFPGINMSTSPGSLEITFDPVRGTATSATVTLTSANNYEIRAVVTALGHVSLCSPTGSNYVSGYSTC